MHTVAGMTSSAVPSAPAPSWSPRLWAILVVLCGALFLDALDVSMVGVALPSIRAALGLTTSSLQWVVSGYVLGYGGLLLLGGRAADLLGRRSVFLTALAVFAVASLFGGLVSSPGLLIAARFVKGAAAAFTAPAGLSLLTTTFHEAPMRNRAISVYSAFGASGFSLGLVLSGLLTEVSWRLTLLLPAPVALLVLVAGIRLIPREASRVRRTRRFDLPGAVTVTAAMLLLVWAVVGAPQAGWASARTLGSFAGAAALLGRFGAAHIVAVALGCLVAGYAWFLRIGPQPDYPAVILPAVLLIGAAFGLGFSSLNVQATAGVADAEQGLASGILQTSFQVGGAFVLAIVTAVVTARGGNRLATPATMLAAYRPALEVIAGVAALGVVVAISGLTPGSARKAAARELAADEAGQVEFEPVGNGPR